MTCPVLGKSGNLGPSSCENSLEPAPFVFQVLHIFFCSLGAALAFVEVFAFAASVRSHTFAASNTCISVALWSRDFSALALDTPREGDVKEVEVILVNDLAYILVGTDFSYRHAWKNMRHPQTSGPSIGWFFFRNGWRTNELPGGTTKLRQKTTKANEGHRK